MRILVSPLVMVEMTPGDGWLLFHGDVILLAKGYEHPPGWVVVAPYRVNGARVDPASYKILSRGMVEERLDCIGRIVVLAPQSKVEPLNPVVAFRAAREDIISLSSGMMRLIHVLEGNGIVGITGSWAYGGESKDSDVDFIIKADDIEVLIDSLKKLGPKPCRRPPVMLPRINGFQILDACVDGVKYTIRVVESLHGRPCGGFRVTQLASRIMLHVTIREPIAPYSVPALYSGYSPGLGDIIVETWRTRYQELAPGEYHMVADLFYDHGRGMLVASPDIGGMVWA